MRIFNNCAILDTVSEVQYYYGMPSGISHMEERMTSKQRAFLKSLASKEDTILQIGKEGLTPENTASIEEALKARELIKVGILQNCLEDIPSIAQTAAERTRSQLVQVIGRKFVLYREGVDEKKKIILPGPGRSRSTV